MTDLKEWIWHIAVQKGVSRVVQVAVAWAMAHGLEGLGVKIDANQLTLACVGGLEVLRNYLKQKYPKYAGWL